MNFCDAILEMKSGKAVKRYDSNTIYKMFHNYMYDSVSGNVVLNNSYPEIIKYYDNEQKTFCRFDSIDVNLLEDGWITIPDCNFTEEDISTMKILQKHGYHWIARDTDNELFAYQNQPAHECGMWCDSQTFYLFDDMFKCIAQDSKGSKNAIVNIDSTLAINEITHSEKF